METFPASLVLYEGTPQVNGEFPSSKASDVACDALLLLAWRTRWRNHSVIDDSRRHNADVAPLQ